MISLVDTLRVIATPATGKSYCNKDIKQWSHEDVAQLKELYATHSAKEVADIMGRTLVAIQRKVYLLGLSKRQIVASAAPATVVHPESHITRNISKGVY